MPTQGHAAGRRRGSPWSATWPQVQRSGGDAPTPIYLGHSSASLALIQLPQGAFRPPASTLGLWVQGALCPCQGRWPEMMTVPPSGEPWGGQYRCPDRHSWLSLGFPPQPCEFVQTLLPSNLPSGGKTVTVTPPLPAQGPLGGSR